MAKRTRTPSWLEVAIATAGMRTAIKAMSWAYYWAVTREALGKDPTMEEVAEWWAMSERNAYREKAAFRKAFPSLDSPAPIYASEESREALSRHAAFGDKVDEWGRERKRRREQDGVKAFLLPAHLPD